MEKTIYTVYISYSQSIDKYYIGYTNDLTRRFSEHNQYTDGGIPWTMVYTETYERKSDAMNREKEIKAKKSRKYIQKLIDQNKVEHPE